MLMQGYKNNTARQNATQPCSYRASMCFKNGARVMDCRTLYGIDKPIKETTVDEKAYYEYIAKLHEATKKHPTGHYELREDHEVYDAERDFDAFLCY